MRGKPAKNTLVLQRISKRQGKKSFFFPFRIVRARNLFHIYFVVLRQKIKKNSSQFFLFRSRRMEFLSLCNAAKLTMMKMYGVLILTDYVEILTVVSMRMNLIN